jgi:hypothetical protein
MLDKIKVLRQQARERILQINYDAEASRQHELGYLKALEELEKIYGQTDVQKEVANAINGMLDDPKLRPLLDSIVLGTQDPELTPTTPTEDIESDDVDGLILPPLMQQEPEVIMAPSNDYSGDIPVDIANIIAANEQHSQKLIYDTTGDEWIEILSSCYPEYLDRGISLEEITASFDHITAALQNESSAQ